MPEGDKPVTQAEIDRIFKMYKEGQEKLDTIVAKLDKSEKEKVEILGRIATMEKNTKPPAKDEEVEYSEENPPKTDEEWNEFFYQNPTLATDLRNKLTSRQRQYKDDWDKKQQESVEELVKLHPDMYKKDEKGNILRDKNGVYLIDENSEKGKIFIDIAGNDPGIMRVATGAR